MTKSFLLIGVLAIVLALAGPAVAHDMNVVAEFTDVGQGATQQFDHMDEFPWKGWFNVTVTNSSTEWWTDFHFCIVSVMGSDISETIFVVDDPYQPTSSQSGLSWVVDNDPMGAQLGLFFVSDPVAPGGVANFQVYTDNTINQGPFGVCMYPTVPEPSSLLAFSCSLLGLAGLVRRRRP